MMVLFPFFLVILWKDLNPFDSFYTPYYHQDNGIWLATPIGDHVSSVGSIIDLFLRVVKYIESFGSERY